MLDIQNYGSFVAAILVFQAIPGASTIAILDSTARDGRGAGISAVMGTLAGDALLMTAAVAGLAALLQANPMLFQSLQWLGVAYLFWMGGKLVFAKGGEQRDSGRGYLDVAGIFPTRLHRQSYQSQGHPVFHRLLSTVSEAECLSDDLARNDAARNGP